MLVKELIAELEKILKETPEAANYVVRYEYDAGYSFPPVGSISIHEGGRHSDGKPFLCMNE